MNRITVYYSKLFNIFQHYTIYVELVNYIPFGASYQGKLDLTCKSNFKNLHYNQIINKNIKNS